MLYDVDILHPMILVQLFHETLLKHWSPGRSQRAQKSTAPKNVASHQPKAAPNAGRLNEICPGQRKQGGFGRGIVLILLRHIT